MTRSRFEDLCHAVVFFIVTAALAAWVVLR